MPRLIKLLPRCGPMRNSADRYATTLTELLASVIALHGRDVAIQQAIANRIRERHVPVVAGGVPRQLGLQIVQVVDQRPGDRIRVQAGARARPVGRPMSGSRARLMTRSRCHWGPSKTRVAVRDRASREARVTAYANSAIRTRRSSVRVCTRGFVRSYQLRHQAHEYGHRNAEHRLDHAIERVLPRRGLVLQKVDGADIAGQFRGIRQA